MTLKKKKQKMGKLAEKPKTVATRVYCVGPLAVLAEVTSSNVTLGF